ncbi:MAG: hypothetical protein KDN05_05175, partial [Verrucomicrobiae bacterium]|nr:hypothetical protein [Verrucomicrobiae bacterium]
MTAARKNPLRAPTGPGGFALLVTLSLMILLTLIAVGFLSLGSIALRASSADAAMATARANARMALILAIGELQKQAGPDQRITFPSGIATEGNTQDPANPAWTAVSDVRDFDRTSPPKAASVTWLVSGEKPDPLKSLTASSSWDDGDSLELAVFETPDDSAERKVLAPVVPTVVNGQKGRFAWWVDDQAVKARVDIETPDSRVTNPVQRTARSQSPAKPLLSVA